MKNFLIFLLFVAMCAGIYMLVFPKDSRSKILMEGRSFRVEIADTDFLRAKGLSGHKPLSDYEGMLFMFDRPDTYGFWMKDMTFPIDIIWIDENWKIVHIENSVSPNTYPQSFYPDFPAKYVLEVKAGVSQYLHVLIDSHVVFSK